MSRHAGLSFFAVSGWVLIVGSLVSAQEGAPVPPEGRQAPPAPAIAPAQSAPAPAGTLVVRAEDRLEDLVRSIQAAIAEDEALAGINIVGVEIAVRPLLADKDLHIEVEGGTLAQRMLLSEKVLAIANADPVWKEWLLRHGVEFSYQGAPADLDQLVLQAVEPDLAGHLAELLQVIQNRIELDSRLDGAIVLDGQFFGRTLEPARELRLIGRVVAADQLPLLNEIVLESLSALPYWEQARHRIFVTVREIRTHPTSEVLARRFYAIGVNAFWRCEFDVANRAFMRAVSELPSSLTLRYWRVVGLLAVGDCEGAEARLAQLLKIIPFGSSDPIIAIEFERLQGPLRMQLLAMERNLLLELP